MTTMALFSLLLFTFNAWASEGPWTAPKGLHNIYVGVYAEQFGCFEAEGKESTKCSVGLPTLSPVRQIGVKFFYRYGLAKKWDFAIAAPLGRSFMAEPSSSPSMEPTTGLGLLETRVRRRLGHTGPLDWSASAGVRSGIFHHDTRGKMTNLGEGTNDLYATVSNGATGLLGARFYTTSTDVSYYYRVPLQEDETIGRIPGDEVRLSSVFDYAASARMGIGLTFDAFHRLSGAELNIAEMGQYGDDRWAALKATQVKVGGRVMMYPSGPWPYLQLGLQRTVFALNNPTDTTFVEVAMGTDFGGNQ